MSREPVIIAVFNAKGGVAKTTTAVNLSACLAAHGRKVVLVDMDAQGNATTSLGFAELPPLGTYDLVAGGVGLEATLQPTFIDGVRLVAATASLAAVDIEMAIERRRHDVLQKAFAGHGPGQGADIDVVVLDCPPATGLMTVNALVSSDAVLIPATPTPYAHDGLVRTWRIVKRIQTGLNQRLAVAGILPTLIAAEPAAAEAAKGEAAKGEAKGEAELMAVMRAEFGPLVYGFGILRDDALFLRAAAAGIPACIIAPDSAAASRYLKVAAHLLSERPWERRGVPGVLAAGGSDLDGPGEGMPAETTAAPSPPPPLDFARARLAAWHEAAAADGLLDRRLNVPAVADAPDAPDLALDDGPGHHHLAAGLRVAAALLVGLVAGYLVGRFGAELADGWVHLATRLV